MKLHKIALGIFLGAASMAASAADNTTSESPVAPGSLSSAHNANKRSDALQIVEPKYGNIITDKTTVKAVVRVGNGIRPKSLRITLNGTNVTRHAQEENCAHDACQWTVELSKRDRLLSGANRLVAFARGSDNSIKIERAEFFYDYGLGAGQNKPQWEAPSLGLSLNPGGAQPWVTLTTGWPANMQDNLDPTQYSLPYRDMTFPSSGETPCTNRYQVVVLNRQNPAQQDGYICAADGATLKSDLAGLAKGTEIVLVGTTLYNNADSTLDTTGIGGTNYSSPNVMQPMGYAAIGISGAAPGSAYESYYVSTDIGKPYMRTPFANGLLAMDQNDNYNFHAGDNIQFEVYPNNPNNGTSNVFISYSGDVHGWGPPFGSTNGFWLLTLDRITLLPIDANTASGSLCQPQGFAQNCGQFFPTGSTDPNVASAAADSLADALSGVTPRQLAVVTTFGQPFQSASSVTAKLANEFLQFGGSLYTLQSLTQSTSTYTLIAKGLPTNTSNGTLSAGVVNSSSAFSQQGQTGFVRGVMARDNNSLYLPSVTSQEDGKMNGNNATSLSIDYDFYTISSQAPIDWPLTDTPGHVAAYHWASQQFLFNHYGKSQPPDPLSADVRYWYHSPTRASDMGTYNTDFQCPNTVANSPCNYPGNGVSFTEQDLTDVDAELYTELTALHDTDLYLGSNGIGGLIQQSDGSGGVLSDQVIAAAYEVLKDQVMPVTSSTAVNGAVYDWLNLAAGMTSILGTALGPADFPVAAAAMGVTSGALWTGSAFGPFATNDPVTPPSYESSFDTTLGQMQEQASTYAANLALSYDTSLDNIYSDWGRLSATGAKTANSSTGWYFDSNVSEQGLTNQLAGGVRRSIYLQLIPQFYAADTYYQQPVASIDRLGLFYFNNPGPGNETPPVDTCTAAYPSAITSNEYGYRVYSAYGSSGRTDMFVLGGAINNQGTPNVTESLPSADLLNILFGAPPEIDPPATAPLNIQQDLLYASVPRRGGPYMFDWPGFTLCYKPGCTDNAGEPQWSSCVGP